MQGDIHSSALKGLENEIAVMLKFDRFFQELCVEGRPDPSVDFDDDCTPGCSPMPDILEQCTSPISIGSAMPHLVWLWINAGLAVGWVV